MVQNLNKAKNKLNISKEGMAIIGVGGVFNISDFSKYIEAGADIVQSATGAMWNLNLASEIADFCGIKFKKE